jgi:pyruvate dehydrogenase E2 component (dihydrolipoamide acetyltransferase)
MATNFTLPELGENVDSGTVTAVLVAKGDTVKKDQTVVQLETDKAVVDIPSPQEGVVSEVRAKVGDTLKVGDIIIVLDKDGESKSKPAEQPKAVEKDAAPTKKVERTSGDQASKKVDEKAEASPKKQEPETKSQQPEPRATEPVQPRAAEDRKAVREPEPEREARPAGSVRAAPSVRKLAREIGVDIGAVPVSSAAASITADDVKTYARTLREGGGAQREGTVAKRATDTGSLPNFERWGSITREKMSTVRRLTAENMSRAWGAIPHVTQNDKADITELEKFRKDYAKAAEREGGKLTVTAILVRIAAEGLKKFPQFNASIDTANSEIVYKQYYNVGVAVDTDWGLLVPSIKNADRKGLFDIAAELADLSERARQRKTTLDELQGSCFTITNLGGIGGTSFSPIVNLPEVAILGVSRAQTEPVFVDGSFVPRTMMPVSLSYDHRVIDGADAARFARWICAALEQPLTMFLD